MPDHSKIQDLMASINTEERFLRFGEMLTDMAESNERIRRAFYTIEDKIIGQSLDARKVEQRRGDLRAGRGKDELSDHKGMTTLAATTYALAIHRIQSRGIPSSAELEKAIDSAEGKFDELGLDSLEELVLEAESVAIRHPSFVRRQADVVQDIRAMEHKLNLLADRCKGLFLGRVRSKEKCYTTGIVMPCWLAVLIFIAAVIIIIL